MEETTAAGLEPAAEEEPSVDPKGALIGRRDQYLASLAEVRSQYLLLGQHMHRLEGAVQALNEVIGTEEPAND